jgi:hypothetical protein
LLVSPAFCRLSTSLEPALILLSRRRCKLVRRARDTLRSEDNRPRTIDIAYRRSKSRLLSSCVLENVTTRLIVRASPNSYLLVQSKSSNPYRGYTFYQRKYNPQPTKCPTKVPQRLAPRTPRHHHRRSPDPFRPPWVMNSSRNLARRNSSAKSGKSP